MTAVPCAKCKRPVPQKATNCPYCGDSIAVPASPAPAQKVSTTAKPQTRRVAAKSVPATTAKSEDGSVQAVVAAWCTGNAEVAAHRSGVDPSSSASMSPWEVGEGMNCRWRASRSSEAWHLASCWHRRAHKTPGKRPNTSLGFMARPTTANFRLDFSEFGRSSFFAIPSYRRSQGHSASCTGHCPR